MSHFESLFDTSVLDISQAKSSGINLVPKLKSRCEELEDIIAEMK